jgi:2-oxoglutarate/2-oxoacid ferredoxin oxidoreductase subunit alpha
MQMRYGSHGDVHSIALCPWSVQEMHDLTIRAFNLSESLRVPVIVAAEESIACAGEPVSLFREVSITNRNRSKDAPPFGSDEPAGVPPLPAFGEGAKLLVTGSTHDECGFRKVDDPLCHERLVTRLMNKTLHREDEIVETESLFLDDATIAFFAFGISARSAAAAVKRLRHNGIKAGMLRTRTLWPFPAHAVRRLGEQVQAIIVPELNAGMFADEVRGRVRIPVHSVSQMNGMPISPSRLVEVAMSIS